MRLTARTTSVLQALEIITKLVDRLVAPLSHLRYGIYDKSKHGKWRADVSAFDSKVVDIERRTEAFIEHAFSQLRSAEGAFDLLQVRFQVNRLGVFGVLHSCTLSQKFAGIEMRQSIRALLEANTSNIVEKARRELAAT